MRPETIEKIREMLDNISYWDTCPDNYRDNISLILLEIESLKHKDNKNGK